MTNVTSILETMKTNYVDNDIPLSKSEIKQFWGVVGRIKRKDQPTNEEIQLATAIREKLYEKRLGKPKPLIPALFLFNIAGIGFLLSPLLLTYDTYYLPSMILSWIAFIVFVIGFTWVTRFSHWLMMSTNVIFIIGIIGVDLLFFENRELIISINKFLLFAVIPSFYLNGRLIGGWIAGIRFDGVNRDVFGLFSLKINYPTYLGAKPPKRQWIFFCGGIGTVFTGLIISTLALIFFSTIWFFAFPTMLLFAELIDYSGKAGKLGGGEFHHLKRERRIIADWKKV